MRTTLLLSLFAAGCLLTVGCQEVEQPTTVLTQEQWKEVKKHIVDEAPDEVDYKVGANWQDKIKLVGFDVEGDIASGKEATWVWWWEALDDVDKNWKVFVHLDSDVKPFRQNLDHVPVEGLYPTGRWKKGQVIKDVQKVVMRGNYPAGKATPYIGLYRGDTRMKIENDVPRTGEAQPRVIGPKVTIKPSKSAGNTKKPKPQKPRYALKMLSEEQVGEIEIDGKIGEPVWRQAQTGQLQPFGKAPRKSTWFKSFVADDHLYFAAHLDDDHIWGTLDERDAKTWTQEVIEVFLDVDGDGKDYMELQVTPNGTVFDAHFPVRLGTGEGSREDQIAAASKWNVDGLKKAIHVEGTINEEGDTDKFWSVELAIPLDQIPGMDEQKRQVGKTWALNVYRFDRPEKDRANAYAWSTEPRGDFHQVDKFGEVRLVNTVALRKPKVTPEMLEEMRKRIDRKVRPEQLERAKPEPPDAVKKAAAKAADEKAAAKSAEKKTDDEPPADHQ